MQGSGSNGYLSEAVWEIHQEKPSDNDREVIENYMTLLFTKNRSDEQNSKLKEARKKARPVMDIYPETAESIAFDVNAKTQISVDGQFNVNGFSRIARTIVADLLPKQIDTNSPTASRRDMEAYDIDDYFKDLRRATHTSKDRRAYRLRQVADATNNSPFLMGMTMGANISENSEPPEEQRKLRLNAFRAQRPEQYRLLFSELDKYLADEENQNTPFRIGQFVQGGYLDGRVIGLIHTYLVEEKGKSILEASDFMRLKTTSAFDEELMDRFVNQGPPPLRVPIEEDLRMSLRGSEQWNLLEEKLADDPQRFELVRMGASQNCNFRPPNNRNSQYLGELANLNDQKVTVRPGGDISKCEKLRSRFSALSRTLNEAEQFRKRKKANTNTPGAFPETTQTQGEYSSADYVNMSYAAGEQDDQGGQFGQPGPGAGPTDDQFYSDQRDLASSLEEFMSAGCSFSDQDQNDNFLNNTSRFANSLSSLASNFSGGEQIATLAQIVGLGARLVSSVMDLIKGPTVSEKLEDFDQRLDFNTRYLENMCRIRDAVYNYDNALTDNSDLFGKAIHFERQQQNQLNARIQACQRIIDQSPVKDLIADIESIGLSDRIECMNFFRAIFDGENSHNPTLKGLISGNTCSNEGDRPKFCDTFQSILLLVEGQDFKGRNIMAKSMNACQDTASLEFYNSLLNQVKSEASEYLMSNQSDSQRANQSALDKMEAQLADADVRILNLERVL